MCNEEACIPDQSEIKLLKFIRSGDYRKIVISIRNKKMYSLALSKEQSIKKRIVEMLKENDFQEIIVKSHNGKITRIENTIKIKP